MFGKNCFVAIPNLYDYAEWDNYMGILWSYFFSYTDYNKFDNIIEIAPGATPKIAKALQNLNFCGTYYIVEPHEEVSSLIYDKTKQLLPNANVILLKQEFNTIVVNDKVDYLVANHPFDDFITSYATNLMKKNVIFQDISLNNKEGLCILKSIWDYLSLNITELQSTKLKIKSDWENLVSRITPNKIILSQYKASYFKNNNLDIINTEAYNLFNSIKLNSYCKISDESIQNILNMNENYNDDWIGYNILYSKNWRIYEKKQ